MEKQPRLFFLNTYSIYDMKSNLENYRDNWEQLDHEEKRSLSLEDVDEVKALIRAFHDDDDGAKLLFVYNPFVDLTDEHGFLLVKDPDVLRALKSTIGRRSKTLWTTFEMWQNCDIIVEEQDVVINMDRHSIYYTGIPNIQQLWIEFEDSNSKPGSKKEERATKLVAIYSFWDPYFGTSSIPQLRSERGREFRELGTNLNRVIVKELVQFKAPIILDPRAQKFELKLGNGYSITLRRIMNLQFFEQFQSSANSPVSGNPQNLPIGLQTPSFSTDSEARQMAELSSSSSSPTSIILDDSEKLDSPTSQKDELQKLETENVSISFSIRRQMIDVAPKENQKFDAKFVQEVVQALKMGYQWIKNKNQSSTNAGGDVDMIDIHSDHKNPNQQLEIEAFTEKDMEAREKMKTLGKCIDKIVPNSSEHLEEGLENVQESERTKTTPGIDTLVEKGSEVVAESQAPISEVDVVFLDVEIRNKNVDSGSTTLKLRRSSRKASPKVNPKKGNKLTKKATKSSLKRKIEDCDEGQLPPCSTTLFRAQRSEERASKKIANSKISELLHPSKCFGADSAEEEAYSEVISRVDDCVVRIKEEKIEGGGGRSWGTIGRN